MVRPEPMSDPERRRYLKLLGAAGVAGIAGCTGGGGSGDGGGGSGGSGSDGSGGGSGSGSGGSSGGSGGSTSSGSGGSSSSGETKLLIQSWWTSGGDKKAFDALLEAFDEKYDEYSYTRNPVAGGAGQNLHTVIKNKVLNGNPPSTWQDWPGANLKPYTDAGVLKDIEEEVWSKNNMKDAYMTGPMAAAKPAGNFVSVPINIHRINNLFYNIEVIEEAGVDPTGLESIDDLMQAIQTVDEETDAAGFTHQTSSPWSTLQLWAGILIAQSGPETYSTFTDGDAASVEEEVTMALQTFVDMSEYFTSDAGSIDSVQSRDNIIQGNAGFIHDGDWTAGDFGAAEGFEYKEGWDHVPLPGSAGIYQLNMDCFMYPNENPTPDATIEWLRFVGTAEAQEIFNPLKGSIPPRTDVPSDNFTPFQQDQMDDFSNSEAQPLSIAHGLAVPPSQLVEVKDALSRFLSSMNVDQGVSDMIAAVSE